MISAPVVLMLRSLSEADLFRSLPNESLARLMAFARTANLPAGSPVLLGNGANACVAVIATGRVRVTYTCPGSAEDIVLGEVGRGGTVGDIGILDGRLPTLTVTALEDTVGLLVTHAAIALTMLHNPETRALLGNRLIDRRRNFEQTVNAFPEALSRPA